MEFRVDLKALCILFINEKQLNNSDQKAMLNEDQAISEFPKLIRYMCELINPELQGTAKPLI